MESFLKCLILFSIFLDLRSFGSAIGKDHDHVAYGSVAVDRNTVIGIFYVIADHGLQHILGDVGISCEYGDHGREVRVDHAGALGDRGDRDLFAEDADSGSDFLRLCICRHNGALSKMAAFLGRRSILQKTRDRGTDLFKRKAGTDDTGGSGEDLVCADAKLGGGSSCHLGCVVFTIFADAGISVTAVDQDTANGLSLLDKSDGTGQGMALDEIGRIYAGDVGRAVRSDISQVRIAVRLKPCMHTIGDKSLRESDISVFDIHEKYLGSLM